MSESITVSDWHPGIRLIAMNRRVPSAAIDTGLDSDCLGKYPMVEV
jgi:hypothetical protein